MIYTLEDVIAYESLVEQQDYEDNSADAFDLLLLSILASVEKNEPISKTRELIKESNVNKDLYSNLKKRSEEQYQDITDEKEKLDFDKLVLFGYTFRELVAQRKNTTKKALTNFMVQAKNVIKDETQSKTQLIRNTSQDYRKSIDRFYQTQLKEIRETGYQRNDKKMSKEIKGWISIAVLDSSTSAICASLHNKFYAKSDTYTSRATLPYPIPRHPNCRSMFITVFKNKSIQSYKQENLQTFLRNNPSTGQKIMGIEKYRLFSEKKIKFTNFVDLKRSRFYTNAEIRKKLNIKG